MPRSNAITRFLAAMMGVALVSAVLAAAPAALSS
jgi:hypothetical protein